MKNYELYIDGQYTPSTSDDWISVENPATKEEIAKTFEYPIVDVLGKPFNERDVKNIIDKLLLK